MTTEERLALAFESLDGRIKAIRVDHDRDCPRAPRHRPTPDTVCRCTADIFVGDLAGGEHIVSPTGQVTRYRETPITVEDGRTIEVCATGEHAPTIEPDPRLCSACGRRLRNEDDVGGAVMMQPWMLGSSRENPVAVSREEIEYPVCKRCAHRPARAQRKVRARIERALMAKRHERSHTTVATR